VTAAWLVFVLAAAATAAARPAQVTPPSSSIAPAALSEQLARVHGMLPAAARERLAAASNAQVDEFDTEDMTARILDGGALRRSRLGRELVRRGVADGRDLSWFMLSLFSRRGRGEPLDLDVLVAETVARRERIEREHNDIVARQRAAGIRIHADSLVILDQITFAADQAAVRDDATGVLDAIAQLLAANPQIALFDCRGHADRREREPVTLGQRRAEAVRAQLIARGVAPARLTVTSAGAVPEPPRAHLPREAGDRRVEFAILRRSAELTPPPPPPPNR